MKPLLLSFLIFAGCGTIGAHHTGKIDAPSTSGVRSGMAQASGAVDRADASAQQVGAGLGRARDYSAQIDAKATIILKYWK